LSFCLFGVNLEFILLVLPGYLGWLIRVLITATTRIDILGKHIGLPVRSGPLKWEMLQESKNATDIKTNIETTDVTLHSPMPTSLYFQTVSTSAA